MEKEKLKTLKEIEFEIKEIKGKILLPGEVRKLTIKHMKDALKKNKNMFKAWMYSMDIVEGDLVE